MRGSRLWGVLAALCWLAAAAAGDEVCGARGADLCRRCQCGYGGAEQEVTCSVRDPPGSLQLSIVPGRALRVACSGAASLHELPCAPLLANATLESAFFSRCEAPRGAGGWGGALRALGAHSAASLRVALPAGGDVTLAADLLQQLPGLAQLTVEHATFDPEALAALGALRVLRVKRGRVALVAAGGALPLPRLEHLEISNTALHAVPAGAFSRLGALRMLSLFSDQLQDLSADAFAGLQRLEEMDLSRNQLAALPAGTFRHLPNLKRLIVMQNSANLTLGERLWETNPQLEELKLESCGLGSVAADALAGCAALQNLSLGGNRLAALPAPLLQGAPALRHLRLSFNQLAALAPGQFAGLHQLVELDLQRNNLSNLPSFVFQGLSSVQKISLSKNHLQHVSMTAFVGLDALRELDLSHNQLALQDAGALPPPGVIDTGPSSPLATLTSLRRLNLAHNLLTQVFADWRDVMLRLEYLDLSYNKITQLTSASIHFLSSRVELDLRHNELSTLQLAGSGAAASAALRGLVVRLARNPFKCDCRLHALALALQAAPGAAADAREATCATPPRLAGRSLLDVPREQMTCLLAAPACPAACSCVQQPESGELRLNCTAAPAAGAYPSPADYGLSSTRLRLLRVPHQLALPAAVRAVSLRGLRLAGAQLGPLLPVLRGRALDVRDNALDAAAASALTADNATRVQLAGNLLRCDCRSAQDVAQLQVRRAQILDYSELECQVSDDNSTLVAGVQAARLCGAERAVLLRALLGAAAALAALAAGAALFYKYQRQVRVVLYARGWCVRCVAPREDDYDDDEDGDGPQRREFDAFVSYSHEDERWVLAQLVARLEAPPLSYKLCLHFRDFVPGEYIAKQVSAAVQRSRRTLVVVSAHFLRSQWGALEFRAAHGRALRERRARLVMVVLGELPPLHLLDEELRAYLSTNTYVKVGDPWFWEKLQYAMPRRPRAPRLPRVPRALAAAKAKFNDRLQAPAGEGVEAAPDKERERLASALESRLSADPRAPEALPPADPRDQLLTARCQAAT